MLPYSILKKKILLLFLTFNNINFSYQQTFTGDATAFGGSNTGGACGFNSNSFNYNGNMEVAINAPQWINSLNCGRCVNIKYQNQNSITAIITDKCPECKSGDLDMFTETYQAIIKSSPSRVPISWEFIDCPQPFVDGNIKLRINEINYYWLSINPNNFKCGIKNIEISFNNNWISMTRDDSTMVGLYFNYNSLITPPFKFRLTSVYGEQIISPSYSSIQNELLINQQFQCNSNQNINQASIPNQTPISIPNQTPRPHIRKNYC